MSTRNLVFTVHPALGGLDVSSDPSVLDPNFLTASTNIEYLEAGQRTKRLGTLQYSPSSSFAGTFASTDALMISSSTNVRDVADVWVYTSLNVFRQRYLAVAGASIYKSDGDGAWHEVTTTSSFGTNANLHTHITIAGGTAVISDGVSNPVAYNPTSTALLVATTGSLWPIFEESVYHLRRLFYTGLSSDVDRVNYTAAGNIFDSTGIDAGGFDVATGDGDRVIGMSRPFYGGLYLFKGPHYGSIHQLLGQDPFTFTLTQIASGAPAVSHEGIISTPTDVYWISQFGVHSLQTTVKYGNIETAFLSLPIQKLWRQNVIDRTDLDNAAGFWDPHRSIVGWVVKQAGIDRRKFVLVYNYALSDPNPGGKKFWSLWKFKHYGINRMSPVLMSSNFPSGNYSTGDQIHFIASDQGLVYVGDYPFYQDDGTSYDALVQTPVISRFATDAGTVPETQEKVFAGVVTYFNQIGSTSQCRMTVTVDGRPQTRFFSISGTGDVLG